jgi:hypothetical protein
VECQIRTIRRSFDRGNGQHTISARWFLTQQSRQPRIVFALQMSAGALEFPRASAAVALMPSVEFRPVAAAVTARISLPGNVLR